MKKNPWIAKSSSMGGLDIAEGIKLLLMGYGVFCMINYIKNMFKSKPVSHSSDDD